MCDEDLRVCVSMYTREYVHAGVLRLWVSTNLCGVDVVLLYSSNDAIAKASEGLQGNGAKKHKRHPGMHIENRDIGTTICRASSQVLLTTPAIKQAL